MQLTNEQIKTFAIQLAMCESETAVIELLETYGFWNDSSCWRLFGDVENNFSSIGNQQASSDAALVEKLINSIDAVIMGDLMSRGIDPKSEQAPQSIVEYLKNYRKIPEGKLSLLDSTTRGKMSEDILLVSTKNTTSKFPNYCIIDNGEGQTPNSLPNTILSLQASNKLRVGAVQGKFNMGGTGVLTYSGKENFQIIISKKRQDIPEQFRNNDDSFHQWGVTIVRREEPTGTMKSSCFKYLAPNSELLRFEADSLPLKPHYQVGKPTPYTDEMKDGTFIKIFDYNIRGYNGCSSTHLHDRLSLLMPGIALPLHIVECRDIKVGNIHKTLYGLTPRLEENKRDTLECSPIGMQGMINGEQINATLYVFKKGNGESYKKNEGILYTLNGQCQGIETKTFFEKLKLGYLAKSMLLVVDCSALSPRTLEGLFLNSRDRLKQGEVKDNIIEFIESELKSLSILKELNAKRRSDELDEKIKESKLVTEVVGNVLSKNKILNNLLVQGKDINSPVTTRTPGPKTQPLVETREFPTFFNLKKKNRKEAELTRTIRMDFETDAPNDYFTRDKLSGTYRLLSNKGTLTDYSMNIINGEAHLKIFIDPTIFEIGETCEFTLVVSNEVEINDIETPFSLTIKDKIPDSGGKSNTPPESKLKPQKALPSIIEVRKDDWTKYGMNEHSAIKIKHNEDGFDFFCNLENKYLLTEILTSKNPTSYLEGVFTTALVVASMSAISHYQQHNKKAAEDDQIDICEAIDHFSIALAPTIIPIVSELSKIESFNEKE